MTRRSLGFLVLSLLLALPTLAQTGDLSVGFTSETSVTDPFYVWGVRLRWTGAQPARDVVLDIDVEGTFSVVRSQGGMSCTQTNPVRCTMPLLTREEAFAGATRPSGVLVTGRDVRPGPGIRRRRRGSARRTCSRTRRSS